jgi:hypothetical protein
MTLGATTWAVIALAALVAVVVVRFELFCFRQLAATGDGELRYLARTGWIVVIAFSIPVGGILFLYCGRAR